MKASPMRKVFVLLANGTQQLNKTAQICELKSSVIKQEIKRTGIKIKQKKKNPESVFAIRGKPFFKCSCVPDRAKAHVFYCNSF